MGEIRRPADLRGSKLPFSYVVVDTETTGLDPNRDELLEIGAVRVVGGKVVSEFSTFVCAKRINQKAARINGITRAMVKDAPAADEAVSMFAEFAGNSILLAHNASFDKSFLEAVRKLPNDWIDTLDLAKIVVPGGRGGRKLSDLCERYGVSNDSSHRALSDCRATSLCYLAMVRDLVTTSDDPRDIIMLEDLRHLAPGICGRSFAVTGKQGTSERHDVMQAVANCGGALHQSVTLKTNYLIVLGDCNSQKCSKARAYADRGTGIELLSLDALLAMMPPSVAQSIASTPATITATSDNSGAVVAPNRQAMGETLGELEDDSDRIAHRNSTTVGPRANGSHFAESRPSQKRSRKNSSRRPLWKRAVGAIVLLYAAALGVTFFAKIPEFFNNGSGVVTNLLTSVFYFCFVALIAHCGARLMFGKGYLSRIVKR